MRAQQVELPVIVRSEVGKGAARRLRAAGQIPAVVYGRGMESLPVTVDAALFARSVRETAWFSTLLKLRVEGAGVEDPDPSVMIVAVQREPVWQRPLSIDFHRISLQEKLHTHLPVIHINQSPGVRVGGILEQLAHEVLIECLPSDLPDHLEVDISGLEIGDSLRAKDLTPPPGVAILTPADEVIIVVAPPVRLEEVAPTPVEEGAVVAEVAEPELVREREQKEEPPATGRR